MMIRPVRGLPSVSQNPDFDPGPKPPRADALAWFMQLFLGIFCYVLILFPFCRRVGGRVPPRRERCLFVCNHVSLLDTILLGGIFWSRASLPFLVLGDRAAWHDSAVKKLLSWKLGYLLDREGLAKERIGELKQFARAGSEFHLLVFPEGTRGNGVRLNPLQAGVYFIAKEARMPIVPIGIRNMQYVSTKEGRFHPFSGLRKVEVTFGEPWAAEDYLPLRRRDFLDTMAEKMQALID